MGRAGSADAERALGKSDVCPPSLPPQPSLPPSLPTPPYPSLPLPPLPPHLHRRLRRLALPLRPLPLLLQLPAAQLQARSPLALTPQVVLRGGGGAEAGWRCEMGTR